MNNNFHNCTVLVVDDVPDSLSLINDILDSVGINTLVALDGKQAISIAKRIRPDLILLDAIMPQMDGFETCLQLKLIDSLANVPVIFMTGLTESENIVKGLNSGGVDYLTKPVSPDELLARMAVHLDNAKRAASAQSALDNVGQNLVAFNPDGEIQWATPNAYAWVTNTQTILNWDLETFSMQVKNWLEVSRLPNSILTFNNSSGTDVSMVLIEYRGQDEILFKVNDTQKVSGSEQLKEELNLTTRESEVLFWLVNGKTNKEIAQILGMSDRTVNKHLEQVFPKLGVENRTAAAGIAIRVLY